LTLWAADTPGRIAFYTFPAGATAWTKTPHKHRHPPKTNHPLRFKKGINWQTNRWIERGLFWSEDVDDRRLTVDLLGSNIALDLNTFPSDNSDHERQAAAVKTNQTFSHHTTTQIIMRNGTERLETITMIKKGKARSRRGNSHWSL
jgi:hypothetical protein